ncbi:divalent-cation tolerance protein CutA [Halobellus limi]|uniref:Divalent cation tolerance protein n=1 Tax=Halobellus limi TaxID=699433 RepID=A0A1H5SRN3_9EURY|nr:divalent-cation tolerance protein CutA [Halobellus limi]QCC47507.1 divalent-cation tolerance protein CutA [Halobellus limi]SEF53090.1 divalent cation tolerance protein [Halobellus limi]
MPTVYVTAPREAAGDLAALLIDEELAACVNVVDCDSYYRWDGETFEGDEEAILFAKTTADRYPELRDTLESEHPNDVPCIERFDEADVLDSYATWVGAQVR